MPVAREGAEAVEAAGVSGTSVDSRFRLIAVASLRALRVEPLNSVPAALRVKLGEHYLE